MNATKDDQTPDESRDDQRSDDDQPPVADIPPAPVRVPEPPDTQKRREDWFRHRTGDRE